MVKDTTPHSHTSSLSLDVRSYTLVDYPKLKELYTAAGIFDPETDAEDRLLTTIDENPDSILVATDENGDVLGTISLIQSIRMAIIFRLAVQQGEHEHMLRMRLLHEAEKIVREYGYNEIHILAEEEDTAMHEEYIHYGFTKEKHYRWFTKKISVPDSTE